MTDETGDVFATDDTPGLVTRAMLDGSGMTVPFKIATER
jgi:hypothetical protein